MAAARQPRQKAGADHHRQLRTPRQPRSNRRASMVRQKRPQRMTPRPQKQPPAEPHRLPGAFRPPPVAGHRQAAAVAVVVVARRTRRVAALRRARPAAAVAPPHPWNRATPAQPRRPWRPQRLRPPRVLVVDQAPRGVPRSRAEVARVVPPPERPSPGRWGSPRNSGRGNTAPGAQSCAAPEPARHSSGDGNRAARSVDRDRARGPQRGTRWVPRRMDRPAVSCPRILSGRGLGNLVFQHLLLLGPGLQDHAGADSVE